MVPARAVAEAPSVTCNGARPLRQFQGKAEAGAHRLARGGVKPGRVKRLGMVFDPAVTREGFFLEFPLIGESGVGTNPAAEAPGGPVAAASDSLSQLALWIRLE